MDILQVRLALQVVRKAMLSITSRVACLHDLKLLVVSSGLSWTNITN